MKRNAIIATSQSSSGIYCVDLIQTNKKNFESLKEVCY